MILFVADDHYNSHPGKVIFEQIHRSYPGMVFYENDWSGFNPDNLSGACELLILNMIADTCGNPLPGPEAEKAVKTYMERGGNVLLLHGSSAAFWHWEWWRGIVGLRWVRGNDPDGVAASTHPKRPYALTVAKSRHPLCQLVNPVEFPEDEIYINLEQTCPVHVIMETHTDEGTFPQCYECVTPWGGKIIGFIPGHAPAVTAHPAVAHNIKVIIDYLKSGK